MANLPDGFQVESMPEGFQVESIPEGSQAEPAKMDFATAFEQYRSGQMDAAKIPHFEEILKRHAPRSLGETLSKAATNLPGSVAEEGKNLWNAVTHPVDTAKILTKLGAGALSEASGDYPSKTEADVENEGLWNGVVDQVKERYGSAEGFRKAVEEEPASVLMDLAGILTLGGSSLSKVPGLTKAAQTMTELGSVIDPIQATGKAAAAIGKGIIKPGTKATEEFLGKISTGAGSEAIKQAKGHNRSLFDTGEELFTGKKPEGRGFKEALKGDITEFDIADRAKTALIDIKEQARQSFKEGLDNLETAETIEAPGGVSEPLTIKRPVDFKRVEESFARGLNSIFGDSEKALDIDKVFAKAADRTAAKKIIERVMKQGETAFDTTPQGMLDFKQFLKDTKTSNVELQNFKTDLINSIDDSMADIPGYKKLMETQEKYDAFIEDLDQTLKINEGDSGHDIVQKLIAIGNDSSEFRRDMLSKLEVMTDTSLAAEVAGFEMRPMLPKAMLTRATGGAAIGSAALMGNIPLLLTLAGSSSPRLVGRFLSMYGYGRNTVKRVVDALKKTGAFDQKVTTSAALAGRTQNKEETK